MAMSTVRGGRVPGRRLKSPLAAPGAPAPAGAGARPREGGVAGLHGVAAAGGGLPRSRARPGRYAAAGARFLDCSRNRVPSLSPSPSCPGATGCVRLLPRDQASSTAACTHPPPVTAKSLLLNSSWVRKWRPLITWLYSCPAVPWVAP